MALKDLQEIDFERLLAVASEVDNLPEGTRPFYQERYRKLERLVPRLQKEMTRGSSSALQAKERQLYNLLSGNPETVKSQASWAKEGKPLRLFQAHHKAPLTANAHGFMYMSPTKHYKVTLGINEQGLYLGNDPKNRVSGHVVQHLGDNRVLCGKAGSVCFSWHPGGTKGMRIDLDPNATVKSIKDNLVEGNETFLADVAKTTAKGSGSIHDATMEAMDLKLATLGFDVAARETDGKTLYRLLNTHRREILDKAADIAGYSYELRSGFGSPKDFANVFDDIVTNRVGAALGAANPEVIKATLQGDYAKAGAHAAFGTAAGTAAQKFGTAAMKLVPKAGAVKLAAVGAAVAPLAAGYAAYEVLDAVVEGATGKNLKETGEAAAETKQKLVDEGYNTHDLRRHYRNGYTKPQTDENTPQTPLR